MSERDFVFLTRDRINKLPDEYRDLYVRVKKDLKSDAAPCAEMETILSELLDMLERAVSDGVSIDELLPCGYDSFYADLTECLPEYTEDERRQRNGLLRKRTAKISAVVVAAVFIVAILFYDPMQVLLGGIAHMYSNVDDYFYRESTISDDITFSVNLTDLESNVGKIIYRDGDCYIEITEVREQKGRELDYIVFFRSHGVFSYSGATLISALKYPVAEFGETQRDLGAELKLMYKDKEYICQFQGDAGPDRNEDSFGFYIFSWEFFEDGNESKNMEKVNLVLTGLTKNQWIRK